MKSEQSTWLEVEIHRQGAVLQRVLEQRPAAIADVVRGCLGMEPSTWVVTGCGDSLFAGMCAEVWFADICGTPLRAIHALHFSRYLYKSVDRHTIVIAISYSGNTARVVEAAVAAKARGASVVAITANADSRLVELADWWLPNDAEDERSNCRTGSFQAACLLLREMASHLAAEMGIALPTATAGLPAVVDELALTCAASVRRIVDALPDDLTFICIGGGYAYPIAAYGAAKLYEAATLPAHVSELEQFVHCEIFPVGPRSCVVMTAPAGASYQRALEIADGLARLNAITIGISDEASFAAHCTHFVPLPRGWDESFTPFLSCIPHQFLALAWAARLGENADLVSNKAVNRPLIERSAQWSAADYAGR